MKPISSNTLLNLCGRVRISLSRDGMLGRLRWVQVSLDVSSKRIEGSILGISPRKLGGEPECVSRTE